MKNYLELVGNLGSDPKLIKTDKATFISLSIAQNYKVDEVEHTDWFEAIVFNEKQIEFSKSISKGDLVQISGYLKPVKKTVGEIKIVSIKIIAFDLKKVTRMVSPDVPGIPQFNSQEEVPF